MTVRTAEEWFNTHNVVPEEGKHSDWGLKVSASTVPLSTWVANKSKISNSDLWLGMALHRQLNSKVNLQSKDKTFEVSWLVGYAPEIQSPSLIHRKRTKWPEFNSPEDFINLVREIEKILNMEFDPNFEIHAYSLDMHGIRFLCNWLSPIAESVAFFLGNAYGVIPADLIKRDNRSDNGGIKLYASAKTITSFA